MTENNDDPFFPIEPEEPKYIPLQPGNRAAPNVPEPVIDQFAEQACLLKAANAISQVYPDGFFIVVAPRQGHIFKMFKFNPRKYKLLNMVEDYIKNISGWSIGGQN